MLRRLELPGLKVEGQEAPPAPRPANAQTTQAQTTQAQITQAQTKDIPARASDVKHGYNPYDQHVAIRKPTTPQGPIGRRKPEIS